MTLANLDLLHPRVTAAIKQYGLEVEILECDPELADTAAFCDHYKVAPEQTCNAIVVAGKSTPAKYACCVILATCKLDVNKTVSKLLEIKRCSFATGEQTIETTEMQIGGVTPIGIDSMKIYVDSAVSDVEKVILGGGNRSTKLLIKPSELTKLPNLSFVEGIGLPR